MVFDDFRGNKLVFHLNLLNIRNKIWRGSPRFHKIFSVFYFTSILIMDFSQSTYLSNPLSLKHPLKNWVVTQVVWVKSIVTVKMYGKWLSYTFLLQWKVSRSNWKCIVMLKNSEKGKWKFLSKVPLRFFWQENTLEYKMKSAILGAKFPRLLSLSLTYTESKAK